MNFEFMTLKDPHLSFGFQNSLRLNYEKNILMKLDFVKGYAIQNQIKNIIFTGDVFDSSKEDIWSFKKYRKNKRVLEQFKNANIDLFSNVGNHDMFHGYENSDDTIFGEMVHDGVLNNLTINPIVIEEPGLSIKIQGVNYSNEPNVVLDNIRIFDEEIVPGNKMFKICILHSNITPDIDQFTDFTYRTLADDFTDIDMFICGHYHIGYETIQVQRENGKPVVFVNNWNFTRVARDYETKLNEHTPEFEHVQISYDYTTNEFVVDCNTILVPFETYENTFKPGFINFDSLTKTDVSKFFKEIDIETIKESSKNTDEQAIDKIKDEKKFTDIQVNIALTYLNDAKA